MIVPVKNNKRTYTASNESPILSALFTSAALPYYSERLGVLRWAGDAVLERDIQEDGITQQIDDLVAKLLSSPR